jgi:NAD(P)-dependent dehydrogenase (short-subunit alcohol dehydrogenase family)
MTTANYPSLKGRRVVVTGGGSGIGAGIVKAFATQGAEVIFIDIAVDASRSLELSLSASPIPPQFRLCDLTNLGAVEATLASVGTVDVLVNNAANDDRHTLSDITADYWENSMAVNLRHLLFCAKAVVSEPIFVPRPSNGAAHAEDDGWVLALVYDPASDASNVTVLDARDLSAGPLARAWFDHHVPPTFHGAFAPAQSITS